MPHKKVLVLCLTLLVVAGLAYRLRVEIVTGVFNALAPEEGWRIVELDGMKLGARAASVERLMLADASGRRIELQGLRAGYRLAELLGGGPVERLVLERLRIGSAEAAPDAPAGPLPVDRWLARLRSPPVIELRVEELFVPLWKIPLTLHAASTAAGELEVQLEGGPWRARAELRLAEAGRLHAGLALQRDGLHQANLELSLSPLGRGYRLEGGGRLDVPDVANLPVPLADYASVVAGGALDWRAEVRLPEDLRALSPEDISLTIGEGAVLRFAPGILPDLQAPVLTLSSPLALAFAGEFGAGMRVSTESAGLRVDSLGYGDYAMSGRFTLPAASFEGGGNPRASLEILSEELHLQGLPRWLPALGVEAELSLAEQEWKFQSTVHLAEAREIVPLQAKGSFRADGGGSAVLNLSPQVFSRASPLSGRFAGWPFPFDLTDGELQAELSLAWGRSGAGLQDVRLSGRMEDLSGYHGEIFFQGLSGPLRGNYAPGADFPFSTPVLAWEMERLNAGVDLTGLALEFRLAASPPALAVDSFSAQLLGGEIRGGGFVYEFGGTSNSLEFTFHDLRLERMLDLIDYEGVEGSGGVSGRIPLRIRDGRLSVEAGRFRSEAPGGVIRYTPANPEGGVNPGLSLVEQALSDYHFDNIEGTLEYSPDGDIGIGMRIQGYNPQMNDGQRINLNLNLSDNLPVLLRSLQAGRTIEDLLEEEL